MEQFLSPDQVKQNDAQKDIAQAKEFRPQLAAAIAESGGTGFSMGDDQLPSRPGAQRILLAELEAAGWTSKPYYGRGDESGGLMIRPKK